MPCGLFVWSHLKPLIEAVETFLNERKRCVLFGAAIQKTTYGACPSYPWRGGILIGTPESDLGSSSHLSFTLPSHCQPFTLM